MISDSRRYERRIKYKTRYSNTNNSRNYELKPPSSKNESENFEIFFDWMTLTSTFLTTFMNTIISRLWIGTFFLSLKIFTLRVVVLSVSWILKSGICDIVKLLGTIFFLHCFSDVFVNELFFQHYFRSCSSS